MISARFYLSKLSLFPSNASAELQPCVRGAHNAAWSKYTPSGRMMLSLDEEELNWFIAQRKERKGDGYGAEFDVFFVPEGGKLPAGYTPMTRTLQLASVSRDAAFEEGGMQFLDSGAVKLVTPRGKGPYGEVEMTITNPAAYTPLRRSFTADYPELWWMALV